jgi:hypothetical protein
MPAGVAILLFLQFNSSLVRPKYLKRPHAAYHRELSRIVWFLRSAKRVRTRLPIHIVVGPERNLKEEARLVALGAHITPGVTVRPPHWASSHHRLSFGKVGALALTQFQKVFIFDNDMALAHNVDELAFAPTPSAVWHTAVGPFQIMAKETCAVTTGLMGLEPSAEEFARAVSILDHGKLKPYDGGDQQFWRTFYTWHELPVRYQAHQALRMPVSDWLQVKVLHSISGLRNRNLMPKVLRPLINYYY